jgi:hypothetical protein
MSERQRYSRADLPDLQAMSRSEIFRIFGSFDERSLDDEAFTRAALDLIDPARVPGLDRAGDFNSAAATVLSACHRDPGSEEKFELTGIGVHAKYTVAEDVLDNRFTFYGETHQLPDDFDWDHNPGTAHWGHDLNRFSYLPALTDAHARTGDDRYARKAIDLMLNWVARCDMERCFEGTPYAFGAYLNNTIHCSAWARCLETLIPSGTVKPIELLRLLKSIHDQICYLEVVTNGHAGNWPTIGCQGVLASLASLPVFRDMDRFTSYFIETLGQQVQEQILPDGVQDELTPHYHAVVVNNILTCAESCMLLDLTLQDRTLDTLRRMVRYQAQTITPGKKTQVAFNDSDPESVSNVAKRLRKIGLQEFIAQPDALGAEAFPYAGVAFLRQRPTEGDLYLAFDGGPFGRGHQHEDKLGFWLHAYGRDFLVDPGRHLYDRTEVSFLPYLVSTQAHSTITIDGAGQNSRSHPDSWIAKSPGSLTFSKNDSEVRASARYDFGYGPNCEIQVVHQREVVFVEQKFWVLFDTVTGDGTHTIYSRFQFAPGDITVEGTQTETRTKTQFDDANLLVVATGEWGSRILKGEQNPRAGWYSASYNKIEPAPALSLTNSCELPLQYAVLLLPYQGALTPDAAMHFDDGTATVSLSGATYAVSTSV